MPCAVPSSIKACGLVAFGAVAVLTRDAGVRAVAAAVVVNGLLCHSTNHPCLVGWDVLVNAVLVAEVNRLTAWQPQTAILTALALAGFAASSARPCSVPRSAVHVACVQLPLAVALTRVAARPSSSRPSSPPRRRR